MADCTISWNPRFPAKDQVYIAFPCTNDTQSIANAFPAFYGAKFVEESIAGAAIFHPPPEDLVRLLQAYMISKDTQYRHSANRLISGWLQSVEISAAILAILLLSCLAM